MKTNLFTLAALAMMVATSCSKDEVISSGADPVADNTIGFTTYSSINTTTKGVPIESNSDLKTVGNSFDVLGYTYSGSQDVSYLTATVKYTSDADASSDDTGWHYTNTQLWPETSMDFYALYSPEKSAGLTVNTTDNIVESLSISNYAVDTDITEQEDLMYATAIDETNEDSHTVTLMFQHALTQINFVLGMAPDYDDLKLEVSSISICNVASSSTFSFLKDLSTTDNGNFCTWTTPTSDNTAVEYKVTSSAAVTLEADENVENNSTLADDGVYKDSSVVYKTFNDSNEGHQLMLIPQIFSGLTAGKDISSTSSADGTYIKITGKLYKTADAEADYVYYLGSADNEDYAIIPLASVEGSDGTGDNSPEWIAGRKITYTIVFGDGASTPGGGGYDEDGDPVLSPITFDTDVANWIDASGTVTM